MKPIGTVINHATPESLRILALWQECISEIRLDDGVNPFEEGYSHYIVIHDPLEMEFPKKHDEWNKRFSGTIGISIVESLRKSGGAKGSMHVKGLYATNGSTVYSILPFTSLDDVDASYPVSGIASVRARVMDDILAMVSAKQSAKGSEKQGQTILDVGCGTGTVSIEIARRDPTSHVIGIEVIPDLVSQCRLNATVMGIGNVSFESGDVMQLEIEAGTVDMAICLFMLHHLEDIHTALSNLSIALKNGGNVISIDPVGHHHGVERTADDWRTLYEGAGLVPRVTDIDGAILVTATKK